MRPIVHDVVSKDYWLIECFIALLLYDWLFPDATDGIHAAV